MNDGSKTTNAKKELTTNQITFIIVFILFSLFLLFFVIRPVWCWFHLDVRAIDVGYEPQNEGSPYFVYEGRTYRKIDEGSTYEFAFDDVEKECIGRAKGTFLALYVMKTDLDHAIIVGEAPTEDIYVYSCNFDAIPEDGEVTDAYVDLGIPGVHGEGSMHLTIKKEESVGENLELFQRFWPERYKNTPIEYVDPFSMENEVAVGCFLCFNKCPLAGMHVYITRQNEKWYFVEEERGSDKYGKRWEKHWGYLIDDVELIEYLNEFMKYEEATE